MPSVTEYDTWKPTGMLNCIAVSLKAMAKVPRPWANNLITWCENNCTGNFSVISSSRDGYVFEVIFEKEEDASFFALRWI